MSDYLNLIVYYLRRNDHWLRSATCWGKSRYVRISSPIFLVGNQGDGLTLVSRMLRRNPLVVSITGNNLYWSGADEMQNVMRCRLPISLRLGGRLFCKDYYHPRFSPPRSWSYGSDDLIRLYRKTEQDYDAHAADTLRTIIREALCRFGRADGNSRFIDKSQVFSVKMSYVDALLKDSSPRFLLITRNPYATCYRAALGAAGDMRRYAKRMSLDERLEICVQHWSNVMKAILEDRDKVSNFGWVRFEDVLREPRKYIAKICEYVELDFREEMIPHKGDKIPFGSKYRDRWYPLRTDVNEPYLQKIPSRYVAVIRERCGEMAADFGYYPPE